MSSLMFVKTGGVGLIPIHRYYNPGHAMHNEVCVVLGKEVAGSYAGKWNFIGGSAAQHGQNAWKTLASESEEELGLPLNVDMIDQCMIDQKCVGGTILVGVHITGISNRKWGQMMELRRGAPHRFVELSEIRSIPVSQLASYSGLSAYVQKYIPVVLGMAAKVDRTKSIYYSEFSNNIRPINRWMTMLY